MSKFDGLLKRSSTTPIKAAPKGSPARTPGKSANPDYQKTTVYLSKHLHRSIKIACLKANPPLDMSDLVEQELTNWLNARTTQLNT